MPTITHQAPSAAAGRQDWSARILVRDMWASLAICVMWLAVLFAAVFGPDFVSTGSDGSTTTIPSAIAVALFAAIGTRAVAKYGFAHRNDSS